MAERWKECQVCGRTVLNTANERCMRQHLIHEHSDRIAAILNPDRVKSDPVLRWISSLVPVRTTKMLFNVFG